MKKDKAKEAPKEASKGLFNFGGMQNTSIVSCALRYLAVASTGLSSAILSKF